MSDDISMQIVTCIKLSMRGRCRENKTIMNTKIENPCVYIMNVIK